MLTCEPVHITKKAREAAKKTFAVNQNPNNTPVYRKAKIKVKILNPIAAQKRKLGLSSSTLSRFLRRTSSLPKNKSSCHKTNATKGHLILKRQVKKVRYPSPGSPFSDSKFPRTTPAPADYSWVSHRRVTVQCVCQKICQIIAYHCKLRLSLRNGPVPDK